MTDYCDSSGATGSFFRLVLLLLFAGFTSGVVHANESGWNPAGAALYSRQKGGTVLIISRQGMPAREYYEPGWDSRTPCPVFSITKSLTALACLSIDNLSPETEVENNRGKGPITLRHLLSQTSGISPGYEKIYKKNIRNVRETAANLPSEYPPGERFAYGPSHYELVGNVLNPGDKSPDNARQTLASFLNRLGIHPAQWRTDMRGNIFLSAGVFLSPEDLLKIGRFILNRGRLSGIWPVLSKEKLESAFAGSSANPAYGLGFWLNKAAGNATQRDIEEAIQAGLSKADWSRTSLSNSAPRDLVCMAGSGGQRVYIIPSLRTVIVRLGHPSRFKDPEFLTALFSSKAL